MPVIRTRLGYSFSPGGGLPTIHDRGVDVTQPQLDLLTPLAAAVGITFESGYWLPDEPGGVTGQKADLVNGIVPESQLPARLLTTGDFALKADLVGGRLKEEQVPSRLYTHTKAPVSDLNTVIDTGWVLASNLTLNTPVAGGYFAVQTIAYSYVNYPVQIAWNVIGEGMWVRLKNGGTGNTWSQTWKRIDNVPTMFAPGNMMGMPGCLMYNCPVTAMSTGFNYMMPFSIEDAVTLISARAEVTTAGAAGAKFAVAVYKADSSGNPINGGLMADFPEMDVASTGVKVATLAQSVLLPPGRYVTVQRCSQNTTFRALGYSNDKFQNVGHGVGTTPFRSQTWVAAAYVAAAPANPPAITNFNWSSHGAWLSYCGLTYTVA